MKGQLDTSSGSCGRAAIEISSSHDGDKIKELGARASVWFFVRISPRSHGWRSEASGAGDGPAEGCGRLAPPATPQTGGSIGGEDGVLGDRFHPFWFLRETQPTPSNLSTRLAWNS